MTNANPLLNRDLPDSLNRREADRRAYTALDTKVDIDLTNPNIDADRRHRDRRQFAIAPMPPSAFATLGDK